MHFTIPPEFKTYVIGLALAAAFGFLVAVNVWYWTRRAQLMPEQRKAADEANHTPGDW